jgi:hypothetical protein
MPYPLSSDVSPGDITASAHYNNLRSDALRLGQLAADSVNLGSILESYESKLNIVRLGTTRVRVEASATVPVSLIVVGVPVQSVANVDLAVESAPAGAAATYYVFANRVAASTNFFLSVATSSSPGAAQRRIGQFYWNGTEIVKDSIQTEFSLLLKSLLYFKEPMFMCGRLTLATGDPLPAADIASSATLFFTPYKGNRVSLYVPDYGWRVYSFAELTLDISGFTIAKNYDIFLYDNAGTLTLEGLVWSNDTLRATALLSQDGRWVKTGSLNKLYLGTIRMNAAGATCDTLKARFIWNNYNRANRAIKVIDTTDSWTYATATFRPMNNAAANKFEYVVGIVEEPIYLHYIQAAYNGGAGNVAFICGFGRDSTSVSTPTISGYGHAVGANIYSTAIAIFNDLPTLGFHYLQLLECATTGSTTFLGDGGLTYQNSGAIGWILS